MAMLEVVVVLVVLVMLVVGRGSYVVVVGKGFWDGNRKEISVNNS